MCIVEGLFGKYVFFRHSKTSKAMQQFIEIIDWEILLKVGGLFKQAPGLIWLPWTESGITATVQKK